MSCRYAAEIRTFIESFPVAKDTHFPSGSKRIHHVNLTTPVMRNYVKQFQKRHKTLTYDQWESMLCSLYHKKASYAEEVFMAGYLLGQYPKYRKQLRVPLFFSWLEHLQGWAEIDVTCQSNFTGKEVAERWDVDFATFIAHDLVQSPRLSHQRASLVLLLRTLRESNDERFLEAALQNVDALKDKNDKLITKAISWTLRTAIKQHRVLVHDYVQDNASTLPAIAVREFNNKYETGTK